VGLLFTFHFDSPILCRCNQCLDVRRLHFQKPLHPADVQGGAFSLVELLVVIGTISLLVAISLPALSLAQGKTQQTACLNNLKQLQVAWQLYAEDDGDQICPNQSVVTGNPANPSLWTDPLAWTARSGSWVLGNPQLDDSPRDIIEGVLFPYALSPGIYHCPADYSRTRAPASSRRNRSFGLDIFLNGTTPLVFGTVRTKLDQVINPAPALVFGFIDVAEAMINGCDFAEYWDDTWYDIPADRHGGCVNLSYLDGHVESHRWQTPKARKQIGSPVQVQGDVQDLRWLQARLPAP
jgi:prepilin-type processing-associated H-X9-DG protein